MTRHSLSTSMFGCLAVLAAFGLACENTRSASNSAGEDVIDEPEPTCEGLAPAPLSPVAQDVNLVSLGPCGHLAFRTPDLTATLLEPDLSTKSPLGTDAITFTFSPLGERIAIVTGPEGGQRALHLRDLSSGQEQVIPLSDAINDFTFGFSITDEGEELVWLCDDGALSQVERASLSAVDEAVVCRSIQSAPFSATLLYTSTGQELRAARLALDGPDSVRPLTGLRTDLGQDVFFQNVLHLTSDGRLVVHEEVKEFNCAEVCDYSLELKTYRLPEGSVLDSFSLNNAFSTPFASVSRARRTPSHTVLMRQGQDAILIGEDLNLQTFPDATPIHLLDTGTHAIIDIERQHTLVDAATGSAVPIIPSSEVGHFISSESTDTITFAYLNREGQMRLYKEGAVQPQRAELGEGSLRWLGAAGSVLFVSETDAGQALVLVSPQGQPLTRWEGGALTSANLSGSKLFVQVNLGESQPLEMVSLETGEVLDTLADDTVTGSVALDRAGERLIFQMPPGVFDEGRTLWAGAVP